MSTTNGTRALAAVASTRLVLIACLNNLEAVGSYLVKQREKQIVILASGDKGFTAEEDTYTAGQLIQWITRYFQDKYGRDDLDENAEQAYYMAEKIDNNINNIENFLLNTALENY